LVKLLRANFKTRSGLKAYDTEGVERASKRLRPGGRRFELQKKHENPAGPIQEDNFARRAQRVGKIGF
jgi:hypothetical protein